MKAAVIRLRSLGDVILSTASISALYDSGFSVDLWTRENYRTLFLHDERINDVFTVGKGFSELKKSALMMRSMKYDRIIDLQDTPQTHFLSLLSGAKVKLRSKVPRLKRKLLLKTGFNLFTNSIPVYKRHVLSCKLTTDNNYYPELKFNIQENQPKENAIAIAPGSLWKNKMYPNFEDVAHIISNRHKDIKAYVLGDSSEEDICRQVANSWHGECSNLCGKTFISDLAEILSRCKVALVNDSGLLHLAEASGTNVLALFGPTTRELGFFPWRSGSRVLETPLTCRPCNPHGGNICYSGNHECMLSIEPSVVADTFTSMLDENDKFDSGKE